MDDLLQQYNSSIINVTETKVKVKKKLELYRKKVEEAKLQQKAPKEPDADGFITVRHKGGRDLTKRIALKERDKKKTKKEKKIINFYSFQIKESKMKRHQELLEKFEEDKRLLVKMKGQRKFKVV